MLMIRNTAQEKLEHAIKVSPAQIASISGMANTNEKLKFEETPIFTPDWNIFGFSVKSYSKNLFVKQPKNIFVF